METNTQEKAENHIIDLINQGAGGRLVIYKPEGTTRNLVVEKRGDYKKIPIIFTVCLVPSIDTQMLVAENRYLLRVDFDIVSQDIKDIIWVVPSGEVAMLTENSLAKYQMEKGQLGIFLVDQLLGQA